MNWQRGSVRPGSMTNRRGGSVPRFEPRPVRRGFVIPPARPATHSLATLGPVPQRAGRNHPPSPTAPPPPARLARGCGSTIGRQRCSGSVTPTAWYRFSRDTKRRAQDLEAQAVHLNGGVL